MNPLFYILLSFVLASKLSAQQTAEIPNIDAHVLVSREPKPLNMDEIKRKIAYPPKAKEADISGMVAARVLIDTMGNYVQHKITKSPHPLLTEEIEKHLPKLKFSPAEQNGKGIMFWVNIPFFLCPN